MMLFVLNVFFAIVVWAVYPESSGRTLEEIERLYMGDCDRLFVVDKSGKAVARFQGQDEARA
jgi:hypothetical protein